MARVTIKDIAKEADLSVAAVSLILRDQPCRISEEKKALVRRIARERNYTANQMARSLATKRSHMLALILPDIQNVFFSSLAKQIENELRQKGYALLITSSDDAFENDCTLLQSIESRGVDGIFVIISNESYQHYQDISRQLKELTVPYVMVDRTFDNLDCDSVAFNNEEGAYQAVRYMLEQGHQKIACVYRGDGSGNGSRRLQGYQRAMQEFGQEVRSEYLFEGNYRLGSGYNAARALLKTDATAVFVCNDMMTMGFLKYLYEQKIRVPEQYSVVGYDDSLKEFLLDVNLTSVYQDINKLGSSACEMMFERLNDKRNVTRQIVLATDLMIRDSVKKM